ncbi:transcription initiation factor TFIID subunit 6 [Pancytospora philotis]|nr:transcription initiation factor TFIID subunit 6 [Pancytospora philotis]
MLFSKETLRSFAQSRGITKVEDDALRILSQDIEYRLKEVCQEASKFMLASRRTKLSISDVNYALQSRNVEPLFGYDSQETLVFRGLPCNIYYVPDEEFDLEEYLDKPLPKIPLRPYIQSHWLAIEGVQPPIQQNPVLVEKPAVKLDSLATYQEELELKQQHKHLLTKELSMYFDKILQTMDADPEMAITCLLNESGIQQLVPYFIHHFKIEMKRSLTNERALSIILRMYASLLDNTFIFIDPYLHELLSPIFSCVVARPVSDAVRRTAAGIVKHIYDKFSLKYATLAPRIINYLRKVWQDEEKDEGSQYGALYCLSILHPTVVEEHIVRGASEHRPTKPKVAALLEAIVAAHRESHVPS